MALNKTFHRPVFFGYLCLSGEVSSGYVNIYLNPRVIGGSIVVGTQIYSSGGVDKTSGVKTIYTPSYTTTSGAMLNGNIFNSGSVVSGVLTITPNGSITYGDTIALQVAYL